MMQPWRLAPAGSPRCVYSVSVAAVNDPVSETARTQVTAIFERIASGDQDAGADLLPLVYDELKALARARMRSSRGNQTLQATALVHEAWLKLGGDEQTAWNSRAHFFGSAARAMRQILVDAARQRSRRGVHQPIPMDGQIEAPDGGPSLDVMAVEQALERLEAEHPDVARIVMLRYFAGLSIPETARLLDISPRSVDREWAFARAWFARTLQG